MVINLFCMLFGRLGGVAGTFLQVVPWFIRRLTGSDTKIGMLDLGYEVYRDIFSRKGIASENLALGVLLAAGMKTGQTLYERPGFHATFDSALRALFTGKAEDEGYPEAVDRQAEEIVSLFKAEGIPPNRIAIDGVSGSGKTTMAKSLAKKLGLRWQSLDHKAVDEPTLFSDGTIYEHHRLLRTQDIDGFDALIYIDEPIELSKSKILKRQRGGYLVEIMDFEKMKRVGDKAFSVAAGQVYEIPGSFIKVKIRPAGGSYRAYERIGRELQDKGIGPTGLSKEELLFLLTEHKVQKGFTAYLNANYSTKELLSGVSAGLFQLGKKLS